MAPEQLGTARFCALAPEGPRRWRFLTASLQIETQLRESESQLCRGQG
jgi:hypothetical protein